MLKEVYNYTDQESAQVCGCQEHMENNIADFHMKCHGVSRARPRRTKRANRERERQVLTVCTAARVAFAYSIEK